MGQLWWEILVSQTDGPNYTVLVEAQTLDAALAHFRTFNDEYVLSIRQSDILTVFK